MFRVVEVRIRDGVILSVLAEGKTERNAEAIASMAVVRRGVEQSFFRVELEQPRA